MANTVNDLDLEDGDYRQIRRFVAPVFAHLPDARLPPLGAPAAQRAAALGLAGFYEAAVIGFAADAPTARGLPIGEALTGALDSSLRSNARHRWYLTHFLLACVEQRKQLADWDDDAATAGRLSFASAVLRAELVYGTAWLLADAATGPGASFADLDALIAWNGSLLTWMEGLHPHDPPVRALVAATENLDAIGNRLAGCPPAASAAATAATDAVGRIRSWRSQVHRP